VATDVVIRIEFWVWRKKNIGARSEFLSWVLTQSSLFQRFHCWLVRKYVICLVFDDILQGCGCHFYLNFLRVSRIANKSPLSCGGKKNVVSECEIMHVMCCSWSLSLIILPPQTHTHTHTQTHTHADTHTQAHTQTYTLNTFLPHQTPSWNTFLPHQTQKWKIKEKKSNPLAI